MEFQEFHEVMLTASPCASPESEKRAGRLASKRNPFIMFREDEAAEATLIDDEEDTLVAKFFDGRAAIQLYSSGEKLFADSYSHGQDGFIVAKWAHDQSVLQLELPNHLLQEDGSVKTASFDAGPPPQTKPKFRRSPQQPCTVRP